MLRLENREVTSAGIDNYGAYINIQNAGGRSIALKAIGAIQASTLISDKIANVTLGQAGQIFDQSVYNFLMITSNSNYSYVLNTKSQMESMFGYSQSGLPTDFGYVFTIHCKYNCGYTITVEPPSGVNLYNQNGAISTFPMTKGDTATLLCTYQGGTFRYEMLSRYY